MFKPSRNREAWRPSTMAKYKISQGVGRPRKIEIRVVPSTKMNEQLRRDRMSVFFCLRSAATSRP
jgi:hypothetical protein